MAVVVIGFALLGCTNKHTHKDITPVSQAVTNVNLTDEQFDNGAVIDTVTVKAVDKNKSKTLAEVTIPKDTEFKDSKGDLLDTPPVIKVEAKEIVEKVVKDNRVESKKNKVETKLEIKDQKGNNVVPNKPIETKVKLPEDAKVGDKVKVNIPDGVKIVKNKRLMTHRIITITIKQTGFITVSIEPNVFKKSTVVKIVIEKADYTPVTGGE
jgi:hypothetical protein